MYDVLVVGAGVGGLYASYVLASKGFRVAIVESKPRERIGEKTCGDAIGVHHFERLGISVPQSVIDHYYRGVKIKSPSEDAELVVPGPGVSVNRVAFGKWLLKLAEDKGAELLDGHYVYGVELKEGRVASIRAKKAGGKEVELRAKFFIDASGAVPALRSRLPPDWPISERPYQSDFNLAYREVVELESPVGSEDVDYATIYLNAEIAPGGYWWLFPKERSGRVVNVGLGVVWSGRNNPRHNYERRIAPRLRGRVLHAGGGIVPTRRPLPTLVWSNVGVVGDAAYTVNPVHGGGIGSTLEAAGILASGVADALEEGEPTAERLWAVNKKYLEAYGSKQASLDVLRMYLQKLSNGDFDWIIKNKIVDGSAVYEIGAKGSLADRVVSAISTLIKLLGRPSLLQQLRTVKAYMGRASELYGAKYPEDPRGLPRWVSEAESLFDEYARLIGFERGQRVKW